MIWCWYGTDYYRLLGELRPILQNAETSVFDCEDYKALDQFEDSIKQTSFFSPKKTLVVRNVCSAKPLVEKLEKLIDSYRLADDQNITVLAVETQSKPLFKKGQIKVFEPLTGKQLDEWLIAEASKRHLRLPLPLRTYLVSSLGNDSWTLALMLDNLANYSQGKAITKEDISLFLPRKNEAAIFDFTDALASRNRPKAVELLYRELKIGTDPYYLLSMIGSQFRNLLVMKDGGKGLHPFVVKKLAKAAAAFDLEALKKSYQALMRLDIASKQGHIAIEDGLYQLVLSL